MANDQQVEIALAGADNESPETWANTQADLDKEALSLIPEDWETPLQLHMDGIAPEDLAREDRRAYCEHLLGNISALFKALVEQAHVARVRLWSDGQNGLPAAMEMPQCDTADEARSHAIEAISNWYYREGQEQKATVAYIGAVSVSRHTLSALHELNRLKHEFSGKLNDLREALDPNSHTRGDIHDIAAMLNENASKNATRKEAGALVRKLIHPKLNIRQLVRTIPLIDEFPYSVRWRWIDSASTIKLERNKLLDMLERKQGNPEAMLDFQRVASVSDPAFCWRKGQSSDLRIAIRKSGVINDNLNDETPYADFKSRLPVFYEQAPENYYRAEPKMAVVPNNAPKLKRKSSVDPDPFLMTMAVHRYIGAGTKKQDAD